MAVHFGRKLMDRREEREKIREALRAVDPAGVDAQEMRWYVSGDQPTEETYVYVAMKDDGTVVVTAFSVESLAERIRQTKEKAEDES